MLKVKKITPKKWEKIEKLSIIEVKKISPNYNIKREEMEFFTQDTLVHKELRKQNIMEIELQINNTYELLIRDSYNHGSNKWAKYISFYRVRKSKILRFTNCFVEIVDYQGYITKISKEKIIAFIK